MSETRRSSSEAILIQRACDGSLDAFEALVRRYGDRLFRFLLARCGNRADAEDALQDAWLAAYRYRQSYRPQWAFSTWLYRIALRHLGRVTRPVAPAPAEPAPSLDLAVEERLADERRQRVWAVARECLSEVQFDALWLVYADGLPLNEVARVLGRPQTWVKVNLYRARQRMARELAATLAATDLIDESPLLGIQMNADGWRALDGE